MRFDIRLAGADLARARLEAIGKRIEPAIRGTLNTTATRARSERFAGPMAQILGSKTKAAKRIALKRAGRQRTEARLIPSSSGIPIPEFKGWTFEPISKTRARILINGLGGRKIAAGFVNPAGGRKPLRTKSSVTRELRRRPGTSRTYAYGTGLTEALGPSVAYFFKQLANPMTMRWIKTFMQQELERRVRAEETRANR